MVHTGAGAKNIFCRVDHIHILDMHHKSHGCFGLLVIGNVVNLALLNPQVLSALQNSAISEQEVQIFYDRVRSDMISK